MDNYRLLKKYKIKLSLFFSLFVMFSFYLIQSIFIWVEYFSNNIKIEKNLENRLSWIINILKNKESYYSEIKKENTSLEKIMLKALEKTNIYKNNNLMISFLDKEANNKNIWIRNEDDRKYLIKDLKNLKDTYKIIIYEENNYNFSNYIKEIFIFILISFPFFIIFYFLWYFFVGKNFKVIEETITSLEDFTANVNHEMKTPLSEIISTLSLADKLWNYKEANEIALSSAYKLTKILDTIIWMANLANISYRKEKIDLINELNKIILDYKKDIENKKIKLSIDANQNSYYIKLNKEHLNMCIRNILSNAIKYSHNWWKIEIFFDKWKLSIKDYWIWIDKKNLKNIFSRYFRESYTQKEWFWLWLALVKKVSDINKWEIKVESKKNEFTKISINFI